MLMLRSTFGKRQLLVNTRLVGRIQEFFEACYPVLSKYFGACSLSGHDTDPPGEDPLPDLVDLKKLRRKEHSLPPISG